MQGRGQRGGQSDAGNPRGLRKRCWVIHWCHWWPFENLQVGVRNQFYVKKKKKVKNSCLKKKKLPYSTFLKTIRLEWLERNDWCFSLFWDIITVHLFSFKIPESTNTIMPYQNASSFSLWAYRKGRRIMIIPDDQNKAGRNSVVARVEDDGCHYWGPAFSHTGELRSHKLKHSQKKKKKAKRQVTCCSTGYLASCFVLTSSQRSLSQFLYWDLFVKSFFLTWP